jgi:ABC-type nitrate/sulfonate/bicarbonate transport system permease component
MTTQTQAIVTRIQKAEMRRPTRVALLVLNYVGPLILLILLWQWGTTTFPNKFFPPPFTIVESAQKLFFGGEAATLYMTPALTVDTAATLWRLTAGFALGSVFGIIVGMAIGRSIVVRDLTNPIVEFLRSIPATATLPLFIILLGGDDAMRIAFIAYGVSWFVIINTAAGVSSVHKTQIEMGQIFKVSRAGVLIRIVLPAALPKIFAGLRIAVTAALLLAIVSEFTLATNGIGYQLVIAQSTFALRTMWSWMLLLAIIGLVLNLLLELIEHLTLKWDRLARDAG